MTTTGIFPAGNRMSMVQHSGNSSNAKAASGSSFADMVNTNLKPEAKTVKSATTANVSENKDVMNQYSNQKKAQTKQPDKSIGKKMQATGSQVDEAVADAKTGEAAKVSDETFGKIQETIRKKLMLDEADLKQLMEELGITSQQLLIPQQLAKLTVAAEGSNDLSVLLTNEALSDTLRQLTEQISALLEEDGMADRVEDMATGVSDDTLLTESLVAKLPSMEEQPSEEHAADEALLDKYREQEHLTKESSVVTETIAVNSNTQENPDHLAVQDERRQGLTGTANAAEIATAEEKGGFSFEAVRVTAKPQSGQSNPGQPDFTSSGAMTQAEQFLQLVSEHATQQTSETSFMTLSVAEQIREIADQLLEKVRVEVNPTHTSMEMTLNPESLGRVNLSIVSRQGAMTAQFTAQTQVAREAIESQVVALRETLESQGLKVDAIEVTVSDFAFNGNQTAAGEGNASGGHASSRRRSINLGDMESIQDVTEEESIAIDMMNRSGNQVDYTA